jgi:hypothetical protein
MALVIVLSFAAMVAMATMVLLRAILRLLVISMHWGIP